MSVINMGVNARPATGKLHDRRMVINRRVGLGRRKMIRFDKTGGDRRSGYARRNTDEGFIKLAEDE